MKKTLITILTLILLSISVLATPNFEIAVEDESPVSDVLLSIEVIQSLQQEGYSIEGGTAKLFSEIDTSDLQDQVTLVIYEGDARIIYDHSDSDHDNMADDIKGILRGKNINVELVEALEAEDENLLEQFGIETPEITTECIDSDNSNINTYGYVDLITGDEVETHDDYCEDNQTVVEKTCDNQSFKETSYNCDYGCLEGKCLPEPEPTPQPEVINETDTEMQEDKEENTEKPGGFEPVDIGEDCRADYHCYSGRCSRGICKEKTLFGILGDWFYNLFY